jgi:hypothetical protein
MINPKKIKNWLWTQKEGIFVGFLWGGISIYTLPFYFPQLHLSFIEKIVLLPVYLTNYLVPNASAPLVYFIPPLIGAVMGMLVDMVYKPKQ